MTYLYRCPVCNWRTEHEHSMKVDPVIRCERKVANGCRCGALMKRVILGGSGYIFPYGTRAKET